MEDKSLKTKTKIDRISSSTSLTFALIIRSTIMIDPVSQFYQSVYPSFLAFWNENISNELLIILDNERYYPLYWMDAEAQSILSPILNIKFMNESIPFHWNNLFLTGYDRQQYSTLQLDLYTNADVIIIMDTDSPFIVIPMLSDFIDEETQKIHLVASNIYGGHGRQHDWSSSNYRMFNGQWIIDGMSMLPQVFHRSTLRNFRRHFTNVMKLEWISFLTNIKERYNSNIKYVVEANASLVVNNTQELLNAIPHELSLVDEQFTFQHAFMLFANNFENKPYSEYTLLMNYAYLYEHERYEWHIDNWNIANENKSHHRITGHWKYAKPDTEHYARVTCCHLWFNEYLNVEDIKMDNFTFEFCGQTKDDYPYLNQFYEDWFLHGANFYSISPQFSNKCTNERCTNGWRFQRNITKVKERYSIMKRMLKLENGFFSANSLKIKRENCEKIASMKMNQVYQFLRLRHKHDYHGRLETRRDKHRNYFKEVADGKV